jgi:predicted glycosyltransferase
MSIRVAFYSHNGYGLGHLRRNLKLAQALMRRRPNADILLITGSAGLHEMPLAPHLDYIKLPSVKKQGTGRWRPQALDIEMEHLLRLRRTMIVEAVRAYRPHLFVADFLPLGVEGELLPTLEELHKRSDARAVIGFRDILDAPAAVREAWQSDGSLEAMAELYDLVLVYGEQSWFDFAAYGLPPELPRYVGLLGEPEATVRARSEHVRILATSGGGTDGYPVLAAAVEAFALLGDELGDARACTAVAGPLMPAADLERLRTLGKRAGARVRRFIDDLPRTLARARVVVGMAGYNTVCDVLSYRRPALIVPRLGPSQEQPLRARILAERGLATMLPLGSCTARDVADALLPLVDAPAYPEDALPDLGGVDAAVDLLLDLVGDADRPRRAVVSSHSR